MSFKLLLISLCLFLPFAVQGANVIINEVAWMGTSNSANDEWIELYNNTNQDINLKGWGLYEQETLIEPLLGTIKANSYYLIERTDDETVAEIKASQKPSGWAGYGLNNKGEHLKLINSQREVIDEINCSSKWFAGNNKTKQTMERIDFLDAGNNSQNWQTSQNPEGTPKNQNSPGTPKNKPAEVGPLQVKKMPELGPGTAGFLIALILAIFSGIIILILKKVLN